MFQHGRDTPQNSTLSECWSFFIDDEMISIVNDYQFNNGLQIEFEMCENSYSKGSSYTIILIKSSVHPKIKTSIYLFYLEWTYNHN